VIEDRG
jgi:hypothetical protein